MMLKISNKPRVVLCYWCGQPLPLSNQSKVLVCLARKKNESIVLQNITGQPISGASDFNF
jgi:hypothetical protein